MQFDEKLCRDYVAVSELTQEIGSIVENSFNQGRDVLLPYDVERILKITSDVIHKIKSPLPELTV